MKPIRIIGIVIFGAIFLVALTMNFVTSNAIAGKYFGGMKLYTFSCTCTGNTLIYIRDYATRGTLALIYQQGAARLFSHNNMYGTYLLGSYSSGGTCTYYVGEDCVEMNSDGQMNSNPGVGTS